MSSRYIFPAISVTGCSRRHVTGKTPASVTAAVEATRWRFAAFPIPVSCDPFTLSGNPAASATAATFFALNSPPGFVV
jgi:hypothetical protein